MKEQFAVFFDISDLRQFVDEELFSQKNRDNRYEVRIVDKITEDLSVKKNCLYHKGYTYRQKDSHIIFKNNEIDGWINLVRTTAFENNLRAAFIYYDNESKYKGYKISYFYEGSNERMIYCIQDASWKFFCKGQQQWFEEKDTYSEIRTSAKFNLDKLKRFCFNMRINIEETDFFKPCSEIYYSTRTVK